MFLQRLYVGRSKGTYIGGYTFDINYRMEPNEVVSNYSLRVNPQALVLYR